MVSCKIILALVAIVCALGFSSGDVAITTTTFTYSSNALQYFVVPANALELTIVAVGAAGGLNLGLTNEPSSAGRGANITATINAVAYRGKNLTVLIGQKGVNALNGDASGGGGGGGGGSFLWDPTNPTLPIIAAGGGGGSCTNRDGAPWYQGMDAEVLQRGGASRSGNIGADPGKTYTANVAGGKGWDQIPTDPSGRVPLNTDPYKGYGGYGGGGASNGMFGGAGGGYAGGASGNTNYKCGGGGGGSYYPTGARNIGIANAATRTNGQITIIVKTCAGDVYGNICMCPSGYSGSVCGVEPPVQCVGTPVNRTATIISPRINTNKTTFANNSLVFVLDGPYVLGRKYVTLTLENANPSCSLAGNNTWWSNQFNSNSCKDEIKLVMPWVNHTNCGFEQYNPSDPKEIGFKGKVQIEYQDELGMFGVIPVRRISLQSYTIYVSFPTELEISISNIQVDSKVNVEVALSGDKFDAASQTLTLEFMTVVEYSMRLIDPFKMVGPNTVAEFTPIEVDQTRCTTEIGTPCVQKFKTVWALVDNTTCTFDGVYTFNGNVSACRNDDNCSNAPIKFTFQMNSGSICAEVGVKPSVGSNLTAYKTADMNDAGISTSFVMGDKVFFNMGIKSTDNKIDIKFQEVTYETGVTGKQYLIQGGELTDLGNDAAFTIDVSAGGTFAFFFSGDVFKLPFGTTTSYTLTAKVQLLFAAQVGVQQKRGVTQYMESEYLERVYVNEEAEEEMQVLSSSDSTYLSLMPVPGTEFLYDADGDFQQPEPVDSDDVTDEPASLTNTGLMIAVGLGLMGGATVGAAIVLTLYRKLTQMQQQQYTAVEQQQNLI